MSGPAAQIPNTATDPEIGEVIAGKYELLSLVAKGGMGRIFLAEQKPLGRKVALKMLLVSREQEEDPEFKLRFFNEAATLGRLKHPNTVTVFDYGHIDDKDSFYMVMEYVDGRTLAQVLKEEGALAPARALRIGYEVARSLGEAHAANVVHRDLKPANIMLVSGDEGEQIKVLDFGIAKVLGETSGNLTATNMVIGSPKYMAPEQIKQSPIDARADIYALGCVIYHLIAGVPPFEGNTTVQLLMAHVGQAPKPLRERRSTVPEAVDALILRCMEKEPEDRFADVDAFKAAVREVLTQIEGDAGLSYSGIKPAPMPAEATRPLQGLGSTGNTRRLPDEHSDTTMRSLTPSINNTAGMSLVAVTSLMTVIAGVAGLLLLALVVVGAIWGWPWSKSVEPVPEVVVQPEPKVEPAPVAAPVVAKPGKVTVVSRPEGATVLRGAVELGKTPLELPVDWPEGESLALQLSLDGYVVAEVEQPWTTAEATVNVSLQPVPVAAPVPVSKPTPKPTPKPDDMDIIMER